MASQNPQNTGDLSVRQRSLLEVMRVHQFGRIENMSIRAGQPVLDQDLKVVRVACLGGEGSGTKVPSTDEFELKRAVCDLFDELARLGYGKVVRLEFKRGLPCRLETTPYVTPGTRRTNVRVRKSLEVLSARTLLMARSSLHSRPDTFLQTNGRDIIP